jgi:hypothetical protein
VLIDTDEMSRYTIHSPPGHRTARYNVLADLGMWTVTCWETFIWNLRDGGGDGRNSRITLNWSVKKVVCRIDIVFGCGICCFVVVMNFI